MPAPVIDEYVLPGPLSEGFVGGPVYRTIVVAMPSGSEQRIKKATRPRWRYTMQKSPLTPAMMDELQAFFLGSEGRYRGFRLKDLDDYRVTTKTLTVPITATTFQLVKRYVHPARTIVRDIFKPVAGTVFMWNGTTEVAITTGWTVNTATGIVTFTAAPSVTPKATYEFDVAVRLETDVMRKTYEHVGARHWSDVALVELLG